MTILKDVVNYILNLGGPVFVPLIMLILGLVAGLKFKKSFVAALTLEVAFSGMTLVVNYMMEAISPAAKSMSKLFHLSLNAIDVERLEHDFHLRRCFVLYAQCLLRILSCRDSNCFRTESR